MRTQEIFLLLLSNPEMEKIVKNIVIQEDNEVLAVFLSHIPHYRAADILDELPTERRNKIFVKIANINSLPNSKIEKIRDMIVDKVNVFVNNGEWKEYREKEEVVVPYTKNSAKIIFEHLDEKTRRKIEQELSKEGYKI